MLIIQAFHALLPRDKVSEYIHVNIFNGSRKLKGIVDPICRYIQTSQNYTRMKNIGYYYDDVYEIS